MPRGVSSAAEGIRSNALLVDDVRDSQMMCTARWVVECCWLLVVGRRLFSSGVAIVGSLETVKTSQLKVNAILEGL